MKNKIEKIAEQEQLTEAPKGPSIRQILQDFAELNNNPNSIPNSELAPGFFKLIAEEGEEIIPAIIAEHFSELKEHIANAISISFDENMKEKAPNLAKKLAKGSIKSVKFEAISNDEKTEIKCTANNTEFTFPLMPKFLQKIADKKAKILGEQRAERRSEQ